MEEEKGASWDESSAGGRGGNRGRLGGYHYTQRGGQSQRGRGYWRTRGQGFRRNSGRGYRKQGLPQNEGSAVNEGSGNEQIASKNIRASNGAGTSASHDLTNSEIHLKCDTGNGRRGKTRYSKEGIRNPSNAEAGIDDKALTKFKGKNKKNPGKLSETRELDQRSGRDHKQSESREQDQRSGRDKDNPSNKGNDAYSGPIVQMSTETSERIMLKGRGQQSFGGHSLQEVASEGSVFKTPRTSHQSNMVSKGKRGEPLPRRGRGRYQMNHRDNRREEWFIPGSNCSRDAAGIYGFQDGFNGAYAVVPNYMQYQHLKSRSYDDQYYVQNPFQESYIQDPRSTRETNRGNSNQYGYMFKPDHVQGQRIHHQPDQGKALNKSPSTRKYSQSKRGRRFGRDHDGATVQASALADQLRNSSYECMVCYDTIMFATAVWSCQSCYHIFHLRCARQWAKSPVALVQGENNGWRCPACQNVIDQVPNVYKCFCGKICDPVWNPQDGLTPHSCGELCCKKRESVTQCSHPCNQLCHPGPCPSCPVMLTKLCTCGKNKIQVRCGQSSVVTCKMVCDKLLNCRQHRCQSTCHSGPCDSCEIQVEQSCYCEREQRDTFCGTGEPDCVNGSMGYFSCATFCNRTLDCGNHACQNTCHAGACDACQLKPSVVTHCPCGKLSVADLLGGGKVRLSCLDPVPSCGQPCNRVLPCSPDTDIASEQHCCSELCHQGPCGTCSKNTVLKCRCGATKKEIPCAEITSEAPLCEQRCNKKRRCGRHRCNQKCCVDTEHTCELICGKKLRCKSHKCEEACHPGYCPPCLMSGFDELTCHCGASVLYPPIPCGTSPPYCTLPCSRQHSCLHSVLHTCHNEDTCPPCTMLTKKMCMGEHEMRHNIPCHVTEVSCGKPCGKTLPVCGHKCTRTCHKGPCLEEGQTCSQSCSEPRKECGHACGVPCHVGQACPVLPCKLKITISCKCGRRTDSVPCLQGGDRAAITQAYQRLATETLATRMKELQLGQSVEIGTIMKLDEKKSRQIECNSDCAVFIRNRRLAEALDISNPDFSPYSPPPYSPFLLSEAKHNLSLVKSVEDSLEELVKIVHKSSTPQRTHSFPPMNSNQRRVVHELAVLYNCSSRSYDQEPKRSAVVTATKESRIPSVSLSAQTERELNPPAPPPVPFLPSEPKEGRFRQLDSAEKKPKTWTQAPDYFSDDFKD